HMFVGESGIARVLQRTAEVMAQHGVRDPADVRWHGVIDLPTLQRYLNFHYSVTLDLFGADVSSNAAIFYSTGLKGRFDEGGIADDHVLEDATYPVLEVSDGLLVERQVPALNALNERLRERYIKDTIAGVGRLNRVLQKQGIEASITLPHKAFNRRIGSFAGARIGFDGRIIGEEEWQANERNWLPTADDRAYVASLMGRVVEPGKFAGWIAPPALGINKQPIDFEYVRFD
ncbi:MAG TPA: benzoyl-CoA 2,3-epoxidase subunit BoxB, partial [Casimicrobiaceae bacterium]|nr:benzoyl-CoA 2,3-epoxidase subunit BoxB [Casimicrobiaceae bacterium]